MSWNSLLELAVQMFGMTQKVFWIKVWIGDGLLKKASEHNWKSETGLLTISRPPLFFMIISIKKLSLKQKWS